MEFPRRLCRLMFLLGNLTLKLQGTELRDLSA
jgi:hypothetical protein